MKKSIYILIILLTTLFSSGCRSLLKLEEIEASQVSYVVFGEVIPSDDDFLMIEETTSPPTRIKELFRITDPDTISQLVRNLKLTGKSEEWSGSFAGCLPWQFFVDKNGQVLVESLINHDGGAVSTQRHSYLEGNSLFFSRTDCIDGPSGENKPYAQLIYKLLDAKAPQEIKKRDSMFKNEGCLKKMLGIDTEE